MGRTSYSPPCPPCPRPWSEWPPSPHTWPRDRPTLPYTTSPTLLLTRIWDEDQSGRRTSNTSDHGDLSAGTFQINSGRDWEARHLDLMGMWSGLGDEKTRG